MQRPSLSPSIIAVSPELTGAAIRLPTSVIQFLAEILPAHGDSEALAMSRTFGQAVAGDAQHAQPLHP